MPGMFYLGFSKDNVKSEESAPSSLPPQQQPGYPAQQQSGFEPQYQPPMQQQVQMQIMVIN